MPLASTVKTIALVTNQDISRQFRLYSELLLLHCKDERLSDYLAGAAYRIQHLDREAVSLRAAERKHQFRPDILPILDELITTGSLEALDELIELTPAGLFDMMRIKGLGGKKLAVLWHTAKIDNVEDLLTAARAHQLTKIPGFGARTEQNIIAAIEAANSIAASFHYADIADIADDLVASIQRLFDTPLVSLCGAVRRKATTVETIEIITAMPQIAFKDPKLKKLLRLRAINKTTTTGHTLDEIPVSIHHTTEKQFYTELFERTGTSGHTAKVLKRIRTSSQYRQKKHYIGKQNFRTYLLSCERTSPNGTTPKTRSPS